ncbi:YceI family protein [Flavobacterium sp. J27]|uniref:YceI family protein n=1 Tax=Flavobacterium sp. J27 TaxID=2060419 RepID=UPI0010306F39|nr:YceI family protein [Flavobacterium sp. J27]
MKKSILSLALIGILSLNSCKKEASTENTENKTEETVTENKYSGNYVLDTTFSIIDWTGSKPAGTHTGTIALKEGSFELTEGKITNGSFVIDMTSITVTDLKEDEGKGNLENHLKGLGEKESEDHFFNTSKFPTSNFKINSVIENGDKYTVNGTLTMKDITKEVSFPATIAIAEHEISLISDTFKIDRTLWGVNYASKSIFDDLKDKFVNDEIELTVKVKATKK